MHTMRHPCLHLVLTPLSLRTLLCFSPPRTQKLPPVVLFTATSPLSLYSGLVATKIGTAVDVSNDAILIGPFNHAQSIAHEVVLDLRTPGDTHLARLVPDATTGVKCHLFIYRLTLTGLSVGPLSGAYAGRTASWPCSDPSLGLTLTTPLPGSERYMSALPLWAFDRPGHGSAGCDGAEAEEDDDALNLGQVHLVLPLSDYTALLAAGLRGAAWRTGAATTQPLMAGIHDLRFVPVPLRGDEQRVQLLGFKGW